MDNETILRHVDHTLLSPIATLPEIMALCDEGVTYNTASVCVPPFFVDKIKSKYKNTLNICTVIGFPLGYQTTKAKAYEAQNALFNGANEIDMVINIGMAKAGLFDDITKEIAAIKNIANSNILKVIIETGCLTQDEKIKLCHCVTNGGGDYIKTSTGFYTSGASLDDIYLFKNHIGKNVKIKASGGIRTKDDMVAFLQAGCQRLGTSGAIKALT